MPWIEVTGMDDGVKHVINTEMIIDYGAPGPDDPNPNAGCLIDTLGDWTFETIETPGVVELLIKRAVQHSIEVQRAKMSNPIDLPAEPMNEWIPGEGAGHVLNRAPY